MTHIIVQMVAVLIMLIIMTLLFAIGTTAGAKGVEGKIVCPPFPITRSTSC